MTAARQLAARLGVVLALCWEAGPALTVWYGLATAASGLLPAAAAWLTKVLFDGLARPGGSTTPDLLLAVTALGIVGLATAVLPHVLRHLQDELNRRLDLLTQDGLYAAVNGLDGLARFESPAFLDRLRLAEQATGSVAPTTAALFGLARDAVTVAGLLTALAVLTAPLAVVVVLAAIPALLVRLSLSRRQVGLLAENTPAVRRRFFYSSLLIDVRAAKEVRLLGLGDFLRGRMRADLTSVQRGERRLGLRALRSSTLLAVLGACVSAAGLLQAAAAARAGEITLGDVAVLLAALAGVQGALGGIVDTIAHAGEMLSLFGYYADVTHTPNDLPGPAVARPLPPLRRGIELRDVWFRYGPDQPWVLRGVNLVIPHGRSIALVGLNGAGKSTLVKLLCRFYDPCRGAVLWDGVDIREFAVRELRQRIGVLLQDYMCYDLTAAENVGIGDLDSLGDRDRIVRAARDASVHDVLAALPGGYDALLSRIFADPDDAGDVRQGATLSGGQWQRVALARTLMRDSRDLLILDEPSSGLDAEAEHTVHERLRTLRAGRTSVLISHRLGAVRHADVIVVLAGGRIVEHGSHADLARRGGRYARLFQLQARNYLDSAAQPQHHHAQETVRWEEPPEAGVGAHGVVAQQDQ